jgi:hypothetical protein
MSKGIGMSRISISGEEKGDDVQDEAADEEGMLERGE